MAGYIVEFFGYSATDSTTTSLEAAAKRRCPFLGATCTKTLSHGNAQVPSGVCAVCQKTNPTEIICCPIRLYADNYRILRIVGELAFGIKDLGYYSGSMNIKTQLNYHSLWMETNLFRIHVENFLKVMVHTPL